MTKTGLAKVAGGLALALVPAAASAWDWTFDAKVTVIEITYMPNMIQFIVDRSAGSCPAGSWLTWSGQGADPAARAANTQAVLAALMTAKSSGQSIRLFGRNAGCAIDYIYLI